MQAKPSLLFAEIYELHDQHAAAEDNIVCTGHVLQPQKWNCERGAVAYVQGACTGVKHFGKAHTLSAPGDDRGVVARGRFLTYLGAEPTHHRSYLPLN